MTDRIILQSSGIEGLRNVAGNYTPYFFGLERSISGVSFSTDAKYGITGVTEGGLHTRQMSDGSISTGKLLTDIPGLDSPVWLKKYDQGYTKVFDPSEETFLMFTDLFSKNKGSYVETRTAIYKMYI